MKKERFDQVFDEAFENAVKLSFEAIRQPSAAQIRSSWRQLYQGSFARQSSRAAAESKRSQEG